jgi:Kef-type K+ transport system membrane component KefB
MYSNVLYEPIFIFISVENGPTLFYMTVVLLFMFISAFFTDIIGVHAIFGTLLVTLSLRHSHSFSRCIFDWCDCPERRRPCDQAYGEA